MRRLVVFGICTALVLGGCGGESDTDTASTTSGATEAAPSASQAPDRNTGGQGKSKEKQSNEKDSSSAPGSEEDRGSSSESTITVKVPPISSAPTEGSESPAPGVKTVKGADNSVQTYGTEASDSERTEAAIALQAYLNARLLEDWAGACSYLAQRPKAQIDEFAQQLQSQGKGPTGCAGTMAVLDQGTAQSQLRQEAQITEVLSFRGEGHVPGDPSYLIFIGPPGQTLYSMPMYLEGGAWKVGLALPSPLPV